MKKNLIALVLIVAAFLSACDPVKIVDSGVNRIEQTAESYHCRENPCYNIMTNP